MSKKESELTFDDFKKLAQTPGLSVYQKIGFPDSYRKDKEQLIYEDILLKLPIGQTRNKTIIDIGCGCSDLVYMNIEQCKKNEHHLILVDSDEMLNNILEESPKVEKVSGFYPNMDLLFKKYKGKVDMALAYSLIHYVFNQNNMFGFIHKTVELLKSGGMLLIGDIPNTSKRRRFLSSPSGAEFLANVPSGSELKGATDHYEAAEKIDDSVIMSILQRFRNFDCETYLLAQGPNLPMANRREDILIVKR